jgi:hypothetical protein
LIAHVSRTPFSVTDRLEPSIEGLIVPDAFSSRDHPAFETATRSARGVPDPRGGRGARLDTRTHHAALKPRASASASLIFRA